MWWPNGYGEQPLYELKAAWTSEDKTETSNKIVKVGFRTVELNQDFVDPDDTTKGGMYTNFHLMHTYITQVQSSPMYILIIPQNIMCAEYPFLALV